MWNKALILPIHTLQDPDPCWDTISNADPDHCRSGALPYP